MQLEAFPLDPSLLKLPCLGHGKKKARSSIQHEQHLAVNE